MAEKKPQKIYRPLAVNITSEEEMDVFLRAKAQASRRGKTLHDFVFEALQQKVETEKEGLTF